MRDSQHHGVPPQHPGHPPGTVGIVPHNERPPDDDLSESSYELLSRSILDVSDDECRTVSVASTDGLNVDDLSSLSDEDDFEDHESNHGYLDESPQHVSAPPSESAIEASSTLCHAGPEESLMTSSAETQPGEPAYLKLEETTLGHDTDTVDIQGVIREFSNESELPDVLRDYHVPQIRLSVKASVSRQWLPISRSYRLLYVGGLDHWAVTHINTHIGAALNATPSSSRFNIVQGSSFDGSPSSSKVQLEPSGSELVVDHCATPTIEEDCTGDLHAVITLDDGQKIIFGSGQYICPSTASLPDLIIIGHAAGHESSHRLVRDILKQHDIPTIEIAVVRPYSSESFNFRTDDLRLSLEGRHNPSDNFETLKTLPIDLYTFLSLDPAQLNRHLAYLNEHSPAVKLATPTASTGKRRPLRRILPNFSNTTTAAKDGCVSEPVKWGKWADYARFLPAVLLLLLAVLGPLATSGVLQSLYNDSPDVSQPAIPSTTPLETTAAPISSPIPTTSSISPSASSHVSRDLTVVASESKPRGSWLDRAMSHKGSQMDYINITVTGDHTFELRVSQTKPKIQIQVTLGSKAVPVAITRPDSNTYVVRLAQLYPATTFNVTAVVLKKPPLRQSFEINLGLKGAWYNFYSRVSDFMIPPSTNNTNGTFESLSKLAEQLKYDLAVAQMKLKEIPVEAIRRMQAERWLSKNGKSTPGQSGTQYWKQQLEDSKETVTQAFTEQIQRAKEVTEEVRSQLWLQSRPLRTSPGLLRTRERALRLRCHIEKTLGREGTRSCKLVGDSG